MDLNEIIKKASEYLSCVIDLHEKTYARAGGAYPSHEELMANPYHSYLALGRHGFEFHEAYFVPTRVIEFFERKLGIKITDIDMLQ